MAYVELVIKIPEEIRLALINSIQLNKDQQFICDCFVKQAIINGTVLPEGHSFIADCISRQAVLNIAKSSKSNWIDNSVLYKRVNELPPVNPQESVIEDIKREIEGCIGRDKFCCTNEDSGDGFYFDNNTLKECLRIIDRISGMKK